MLRDRYAPQDLFALVPKLQLALDPELAQLDRLLDDDERLEELASMLRGKSRSETTRQEAAAMLATAKPRW